MRACVRVCVCVVCSSSRKLCTEYLVQVQISARERLLTQVTLSSSQCHEKITQKMQRCEVRGDPPHQEQQQQKQQKQLREGRGRDVARQTR